MAEGTSVTLSRSARMPVFLVLALLALTILYPIVYLGVSAFRSKSDYLADPFGLPRELTVDNFVNLWNNYSIGTAFVNSVTVIAVALSVQLVIAGLAGYALAKLPVPGGKAVRGLFALIMLVPSQVLIIPIYLLLANLGLVGSLSGLMVVYVATGLPFATFFLSITFSAIENDVLEAARVDGAGFLRGFVSVALPIGASGVATLGVLQFLGMWNELLFAYILLPDDSLRLITPALAAIGGRFTGDPTLVAAGLILTSLPPVVLLIAAARHVMSGVGASLGR